MSIFVVIALALYNLAWIVLSPLIVLWILARYRGRRFGSLAERFGSAEPLSENTPTCNVWVHGASAGEHVATEAIFRLGANLRQRSVLTTTSAAGLEALRARHKDVPSALFPFDVFLAHAWRLRVWKPQAAILLESEFWSGWLWALRRRGIPLYWLNARISDRSHRRLKRIAWLVRGILGHATAVVAQSAEDAARIRDLGIPDARITVAPNLKILGAMSSPTETAKLPDGFDAWDDKRPFVMFSSVHPNEAAAIQTIMAALPATTRCVIAARHPERTDELRAALDARIMAHETAFFVQKMGVLSGLYPRAAAVVVGGTFNDVGGHNPIEAAAAGAPVVIGPNFGTQKAGVELLQSVGAIAVCADAHAAGKAVAMILANPAAARTKAAAGVEAIAQVCAKIEAAYGPVVRGIVG